MYRFRGVQVVGYTYEDGSVLCFDCSDVDADTESSGPVFSYDECATELTCDNCNEYLVEPYKPYTSEDFFND